MARQHRDTESADHRLFDGLVAAELHAHLDLEFVMVEQLLDGLARAGAGLAYDEGLFRQAFQRNALFIGERVVGRGQHDQRIQQKGFGDRVALLGRLAEDVEVILIVVEEREDALTVRYLHRDIYARILPAKTTKNNTKQKNCTKNTQKNNNNTQPTTERKNNFPICSNSGRPTASVSFLI